MSEITVPEGWSNKKYRDLVTLQYGKSPKDILTNDGEYTVMGTGGVVGSGTDYLCEGNSTVIGRKGTIDKPTYIEEKFWSIDTTYYTDAYNGVQPKWFFYNVLNQDLSKFNEATGVPSLNRDVLYSIRTIVPPLPEQQKIASILTSVDEVIEKTQYQINKIQDLKKGEMNELLTRGIGHTEFKDSPVGRIPKGWEVKSFGDFVVEYRGGAALRPSDFVNDGFPVIPKKGVQYGGRLILDDDIQCSLSFASSNRTHIVDNRFVVATLRDLVPSGPTIGLMVLFYQSQEFLLAQGVYGFRLEDELEKKFIVQLSNTDWYRNEMRKMFVGSTQVHIRTGEFQRLLIPVPPLVEQQRIASILSSIDKNIEEKQRKLTQIQSLKKSLMQDLLTGKKRVMV